MLLIDSNRNKATSYKLRDTARTKIMLWSWIVRAKIWKNPVSPRDSTIFKYRSGIWVHCSYTHYIINSCLRLWHRSMRFWKKLRRKCETKWMTHGSCDVTLFQFACTLSLYQVVATSRDKLEITNRPVRLYLNLNFCLLNVRICKVNR